MLRIKHFYAKLLPFCIINKTTFLCHGMPLNIWQIMGVFLFIFIIIFEQKLNELAFMRIHIRENVQSLKEFCVGRRGKIDYGTCKTVYNILLHNLILIAKLECVHIGSNRENTEK